MTFNFIVVILSISAIVSCQDEISILNQLEIEADNIPTIPNVQDDDFTNDLELDTKINNETIYYSENNQNKRRIIGGSNARIEDYPYSASLRNGNQHFCGGSIISPHYVLTAAHCIYKPTGESIGKMRVVVGTNNLKKGGDVHTVKEIVYLSSYDPATMSNDIGFVRVYNSFRFSNRVKAISIDESYIGGGHTVKIAGWGAMGNGQPATILQHADLNTISNEACGSLLANIGLDKICTHVPAGKGACFGDSGSALTLNGKQIGISSFGVKNCALGYPDGFARTSTFISFIKDHMT